jgi:hypothetical protein
MRRYGVRCTEASHLIYSPGEMRLGGLWDRIRDWDWLEIPSDYLPSRSELATAVRVILGFLAFVLLMGLRIFVALGLLIGVAAFLAAIGVIVWGVLQ